MTCRTSTSSKIATTYDKQRMQVLRNVVHNSLEIVSSIRDYRYALSISIGLSRLKDSSFHEGVTNGWRTPTLVSKNFKDVAVRMAILSLKRNGADFQAYFFLYLVGPTVKIKVFFM